MTNELKEVVKMVNERIIREGLRQYVTSRDEVLVWSCVRDRTLPVLTVSLALKWHELYVVHPNDSAEVIPFAQLAGVVLGDVPYVDNAPNPACVRRLAEVRGWWLDDLAEELIVGRWQMEGTR